MTQLQWIKLQETLRRWINNLRLKIISQSQQRIGFNGKVYPSSSSKIALRLVNP